MILYLPFLVLALGGVIAYGSAGLRRQIGTVVIVGASAWSLALLSEPRAIAWAIGPLLASGWLKPSPERQRSTFEVLTRRAVTIAVLSVVALVLASRLPVGENPLLLNVVPWLLGAVGTAWLLRPVDAAERLQGQVLMVGATGALLLAAIPASLGTATATGVMAMMPILGARLRTPTSWGPLLSSLMLLAAGAGAVAAAVGIAVGGQIVGDIPFSLAGPSLIAAAIAVTAGVLLAPVGLEWAALLSALALIATPPSLRWSALAGLIAVITALAPSGERPAWLGLAALAAAPLIAVLGPVSTSARLQTVTLGVGLVLLLYAARQPLLRVFVLPATSFLVLMAVSSLSPGNLTRFQWIAAAGAILLLALMIFARVQALAAQTVVLADWLLAGLLLLALSARDGLGLGVLAVAVIAVDLAIVRLDGMPATRPGWPSVLAELARSNWPPSATFAGATLAVIAALQASLALGLLAALWWAGLQLSPLVDRRALALGPKRPQSRARWLGPALGLIVGVVPALVLRMLRL